MTFDRILDGARLGAVRDSGVLDAPNEVFERLNRLAVVLLGVDASMVSIVAADRQIFVGQAGMTEPWASAGEMPMPYSFCQHVVEQDAPLIVEDARAHPLVAGNLSVRDGEVIAYAGMPLRTRDGHTLGSFCAVDRQPRAWSDRDLQVLRDLTALAVDAVETRRAVSVQPFRDRLTGLYDRAHFARAVALAEESPRPSGCAAVLALGLDGFRLVNEALGHAGGDQVLRTVARRLTGAVRDGDLVCRLGGDEFLIYCRWVEDEADALRVAERLRRAVTDAPCEVGGAEHRIAASLGAATAHEPVDADALIEAAIAALERTKAGNPRPERIDPERRARAEGRLSMRNAVAGAHERGEMSVVYQPLFELSSRRPREFEALVRWHHPQFGSVAPDQFIPAAEASGSIVALGEWVLQRACLDVARWVATYPGTPVTLAVNVAPVQLRAANFIDVVERALADADLAASSLTIELTERTLLDDAPLFRTAMTQLREMGARIALDDFGTGYSALGYLTRFPIDTLKLDRIFIAALGSAQQSSALVGGLITLAKSLGLRTVAEGIETEDQLRALRAIGCDLGQGYFLGRPGSDEAVATFLEAEEAAAG